MNTFAQAIDIGAFEVIQSKVQDRIVDFLALRKPLTNMAMNPTTTTGARAYDYLVIQGQLEDNLTTVLADINIVKSGGDINSILGDIPMALAFIYAMEKQINDVHALMKEAGYTVPFDWKPVFILGGMALVGLFIVRRF